MAKFRQGDLVLQNNQRIIQGTDVVLLDDQAAYLQTLNVSSLSNLTTLVLDSGVQIDEFSNDGTLAGATPDTIVPTEYAVKTYVDNKISGSIGAGVNDSIAIYDGSDSIKDSLVFIDSTGGVTGISNLSVDEDIDAFDISASGDILAVGNVTCNDLYTTGSTIHVDSGQIKSSGVNIELYHNGIKEFETIVGGIRINDSFNITADSTATTMTGNLDVSGSVNASTLQLEYGVTINEFSNNKTTDSTSVVLTSAAVQDLIGDFSADRIVDGNTSVVVSDSGTPSAITTVNGSERMNITEDIQIIGTSGGLNLTLNSLIGTGVITMECNGGAERLYLQNNGPCGIGDFGALGTNLWVNTNTDDFLVEIRDEVRLNLEYYYQTFGVATDTNLYLDQFSNIASISVGNNQRLYFTPDVQVLGSSPDTNITLNQPSNIIGMEVGNIQMIWLDPDVQRFGKLGDTYIDITQSTDRIDMQCGNTTTLSLVGTGQTLGVSGDTRITLNQSTNTITMHGGSVEMFDLQGTNLRLGQAGDTSLYVNSGGNQLQFSCGGLQVALFTNTYTRLNYGATTVLTTNSLFGVTVSGTSNLSINNEPSGKAIRAADHGTATSPEVVNVVYGTGSPPTASTTPIGTIFVKYIP